jgi:tRNA (cytidine32/uridine32-2'-O)-methyltransferase
MKNFGLLDLVLVDPRLHRSGDEAGSEPFFERESRRMAWHAGDVLDRARRVETLEEALADRALVLATAPRAYSGISAHSPEEAAEKLCSEGSRPSALVFGSESSGMTLEEISRCAGVAVIPTDPGYRDLNLAQSAAVMAYLLFRSGEGSAAPSKPEGASHQDLSAVAADWLEIAQTVGFLQTGGEPVARQMRSLLHRSGLTRREAGLLRSLGRRIQSRFRDGEG